MRQQVEQLQHELEEWKRGHRVHPRRVRQAPIGKKPGHKQGHVSSGRPYLGEAEVGREVHHSQEHCRGCSQAVVPTEAVQTRYVEELVPARRRVVAHRLSG